MNKRSIAIQSVAFLWLSIGWGPTIRPTAAQDAPSPRQQPLPAQDSMNQIVLASGFQIELVAAEPLIRDPVDVAFDDAGRMWVVEMHDYPFQTSASPTGCIKVLDDSNQDGVYDRANVFADNLDMPTGVALWKGGAVVTLAGELAYFPDQDGDSKADGKQQWIRGFSEDNEQLRANHPQLGPDGLWYIACGLRGGSVQLGNHFTSEETEPLNIGSRDIRFHLNTQTIEPVTGPAQFGMCFDALGRRLFCSNRNPAVQVVFEQSDLNGNPLAGLVPSTIDVLPAGVDSRVYPLVDAWTTSNLHAGQFTAACGVYVHNPNAGISEVYACEPTGSLVKREALSQVAGAIGWPTSNHTIDQSTDELEREWLASRDPWFRPVNITVDPSDAIVIVDMHRAVIEHPQWVPEELKNRLDERWGSEAGRVFRVHRHVAKFGPTIAGLHANPLGSRPSSELADLLSEENSWIRKTASRLLIERNAIELVPRLLSQAASRRATDLTRIVSLRLAVQLNAGLPENFGEYLSADQPRSFLIAALRLGRSFSANLSVFQPQIARLLGSGQDAIQFEALLCLATLNPAAIDRAAMRSVTQSNDPYLLVAASSAYRSLIPELLDAWLTDLADAPDIHRGAQDQSYEFISAAADKLTATVLKQSSPRVNACKDLKIAWNKDGGLAAGIARLSVLHTSLKLAEQETLALFNTATTEEGLDSVSIWDQIRSHILNPTSPLELRRIAISTLGHSPRAVDQQFLEDALKHNVAPALFSDLLSAWSQTGDENCDPYYLQLLSTGTPQQKASAVALLGQSQTRLTLVAGELTSGRLTPKILGAIELKQLRDRASGRSREVLDTFLTGLIESDRSQVVAAFKSALNLNGDPLRGQAIFVKQCAACHRIGKQGVDVGPDISDSRTKQPAQLLASILDPNSAIDNNYLRFVVLTKDDRIVEGIIAEETSDAIVMKGQGDTRTVILRVDIEQLKATGTSLMPEGFESQVDTQAMADLIAYIKEWRYLDGAVPGK